MAQTPHARLASAIVADAAPPWAVLTRDELDTLAGALDSFDLVLDRCAGVPRAAGIGWYAEARAQQRRAAGLVARLLRPADAAEVAR